MTGHQSPPWRIGLPFIAGALILGAMGVVRGERFFLLGAAFVLTWGALWMWGAARAGRDQAKVVSAAAFQVPEPGEAVVLGRATRGPLRRAGVLCAGVEALLWVPGDLSGVGRIGQVLPLGALTAGGREVRTVIAFEDLASYRMVAGVFAGDRLTLRRWDHGAVDLRLRDPETFALLLETFAAFTGGGDPESP
jgi:hypothetical protein